MKRQSSSTSSSHQKPLKHPSELNREWKYWCFISYRHADNKVQDREWASWLHRELERYEVPAELIGTRNSRGDIIPEKIYPVFRDEESLPANANLTTGIANALGMSRFLVVLCSPRANKSKYVFGEIVHFKKLFGEDRIVSAIIDGEPGGTEESECFPQPLRHPVAPTGQIDTSKTVSPVAADFRLPDGQQGFTSAEAYRFHLSKYDEIDRLTAQNLAQEYENRLQLMKLKIVAGILGVPLDDLRKRDKLYQLELAEKKARNLQKWIGALALLALFAVSGGLTAFWQRSIALENSIAASKRLASEYFRDGSVSKGLTIFADIADKDKKGRLPIPRLHHILDNIYFDVKSFSDIPAWSAVSWNGRLYIKDDRGDFKRLEKPIYDHQINTNGYVILLSDLGEIDAFSKKTNTIVGTINSEIAFSKICDAAYINNKLVITTRSQSGVTNSGIIIKFFEIDNNGNFTERNRSDKMIVSRTEDAETGFCTRLRAPKHETIRKIETIENKIVKQKSGRWKEKLKPTEGKVIGLNTEPFAWDSGQIRDEEIHDTPLRRFYYIDYSTGMGGATSSICYRDLTEYEMNCQPFGYPWVAGTLTGIRTSHDGEKTAIFGRALQIHPPENNENDSDTEGEEEGEGEGENISDAEDEVEIETAIVILKEVSDKEWQAIDRIVRFKDVVDVAFSFDDEKVAIVERRNVYIVPVNDTEKTESVLPFSQNISSIDWINESTLLIVTEDGLSYSRKLDGTDTWPPLDVGSFLRQREKETSKEKDSENGKYWRYIASTGRANLALISYGHSAALIDTDLGIVTNKDLSLKVEEDDAFIHAGIQLGLDGSVKIDKNERYYIQSASPEIVRKTKIDALSSISQNKDLGYILKQLRIPKD